MEGSVYFFSKDDSGVSNMATARTSMGTLREIRPSSSWLEWLESEICLPLALLISPVFDGFVEKCFQGVPNEYVEILDVKDMEVQAHFDILVVRCHIGYNP